MAEIVLTKGRLALVDDEDFDYLSQWKWYFHGHAPATGTPKQFMHHKLLQPLPGFIVDHINRDSLDNRKANLRIATQADNTRNRSKSQIVAGRLTTSRYKGVARGNRKWVAYIGHAGRRKHLGTFATESEAAEAYDTAAVLYFGEFACLNFPK